MQPFEPELREALKKAHSGLTDADIEAVEAMLSRRQDIDRKRRPEQARRLDLEWQALTAQKVPKLREVMRAFDRQQIRQQRPRPKPAVEIKRKPAAG